MRYLLAFSVVLNLLLLTTIVGARVDPSRQSESFTGADPSFGDRQEHARAFRAESIGDLVPVLRQSGLAADDIKAMALGWLEAEYRAASGDGAGTYWHQQYAPRRTELRRRIALEEAVRRELVSVFGESAAEDPAFDAVFRPLGPAYAFLSPAAQVALQRHELEQFESDSPAGSRVISASLRCIATTGAARPPAVAALPPGLTDPERTAYRMRFSALSGELRQSWSASSEPVFRRVFERLEQLPHANTPAAQSAIRFDLRELMGDEAFDRFWSLRDPLYPAMRTYLEHEGIPDSRLPAVYSIVNRAQEALLAGLAGAAGDESRLMQAIGRAKQEEAARLEQLLGKEVAAGLEAAMSAAAMELSDRAARC